MSARLREPPLHGVHLLVERRGEPAAVPARLGGVDRRDQRHAEHVGERDRRVRDEPVVGVHDVRPPAPSQVSAARSIAWPIPSVQATRSRSNSRCGGSSATRSTRTPSTTLVAVGCVCASVPAGLPGQHDDLVPGRGQLGRQRVHVPAEPADHHRRVLPRDHQHPHGRTLLVGSGREVAGVEVAEGVRELGGPPAGGQPVDGGRVGLRAVPGVVRRRVLADHERPVARQREQRLLDERVRAGPGPCRAPPRPARPSAPVR